MSAQQNNQNFQSTLMFALVPLALLGVVVFALLSGGPTKIFKTDLPPVEELHVLRHTLEPDVMRLDVINSGPDPTDIAQVMVRGAFWQHTVTPKRELKPLEKAEVTIRFPWNLGEPVEIILLTGSGVTFDYEIEVASVTPKATFAVVARFAMLGIYVGVIPVALGICWFPFLRRLDRDALSFLLYFTTGLLAFLALDAILEGFEVAEHLPGVFHAEALLILGIIGSYLILLSIESRTRAKHSQSSGGVVVSWIIALGIGLHNLGEGLAIGSAYVLGELTLGAMLVVGFTIHNATEGIAIVAPILREPAKLRRLVGLGLLAGGPTIIGCWIGAFTYSQIWALLFLGIGAGAIIQVIGAIIGRKPLSETLTPLNMAGLFTGYLFMYATGLMVGG